MDELDSKIIELLEKNSRKRNVEIAKQLKVSEGTIRKRIQQLINKGIIRRFTVRVGTVDAFSAIVLLKTKPQIQTNDIVSKLRKIKGIKSISETAGKWDIVFRAIVSSAEQFNEIIEKIRSIDGIEETQSLTILKTE